MHRMCVFKYHTALPERCMIMCQLKNVRILRSFTVIPKCFLSLSLASKDSLPPLHPFPGRNTSPKQNSVFSQVPLPFIYKDEKALFWNTNSSNKEPLTNMPLGI